MDGWGFLVGFVGLLVVTAISAFIGLRWQKKREKAIRRIAGSLGFTLEEGDNWPLLDELSWMDCFHTGHGQHILHTMRGRFGCREAIAVDSCYSRQVGRSWITYFFSACVFPLKGYHPSLMIRPENVKDRMAAAAGFDDIDFESAEFSEKFFVGSESREFAYDVCHPQMMEWLLAHPGWKFEFVGRFMSVTEATRISRWSEAEFRRALQAACDFLGLVPAFVWEKHMERDPEPSAETTPRTSFST